MVMTFPPASFVEPLNSATPPWAVVVIGMRSGSSHTGDRMSIGFTHFGGDRMMGDDLEVINVGCDVDAGKLVLLAAERLTPRDASALKTICGGSGGGALMSLRVVGRVS